MKIHFAMAGLGRGGAERQAVILAGELLNRGHDVSVSVAYGGDHYERFLRELGIPVIVLVEGVRPENGQPHTVIPRALRRFFALVRLTRRERYDVIQSFGRTAGVYAWPLKFFTRSKLVFGVRGSARVSNPLFRLLQKMAANASDLIISNSLSGRDVVVSEGINPQRVVVIENGIDTNRFKIEPVWREEVRKEFGISDRDYLVGIVGRLHPVKNHEAFLRAASLLLEESSRYQFLIVGHDEPPRLDNLRKLSSSLGIERNVIWAGARNDVERFYNAMDVSVLCSHTEGFPNVVAEAMACGTPCVVTSAGDAPRIVGPLGVVVPQSDPDRLAVGITETIGKWSENCPVALRESIVQHWSVDHLVERTAAVYESPLMK